MSGGWVGQHRSESAAGAKAAEGSIRAGLPLEGKLELLQALAAGESGEEAAKVAHMFNRTHFTPDRKKLLCESCIIPSPTVPNSSSWEAPRLVWPVLLGKRKLVGS